MGSRGVAYREVGAKSALTRVRGMPFAWSLNPYRGCSHACTYCFAREYHARMGRDTGAGFDREIEVKVNFPDVLAAELRHLRQRETVALGTGTDPYQPCEGRYRLTRRTLDALVASPLPLVIVTKGTLIVRDIDLLARLNRSVDVRVCFSVSTISDDVARRSEPDAPPPRARLEAMRRLVAAGIEAGVLCAPVLPGLTDSEEALDAVGAAAAENGAAFLHSRPLKLDPGVRGHYFAFLADHFPVLLPPTAAQFADRVNPARGYDEELEQRFDRVRARHGFTDDDRPRARRQPEREGVAQLRLAI